MWSGTARRGRAGQALKLGGADVADGTTAKFIRRGPRRMAKILSGTNYLSAPEARGTRGLSTPLSVFTNECLVNKPLNDPALFLPKGTTVMTNHLIEPY